MTLKKPKGYKLVYGDLFVLKTELYTYDVDRAVNIHEYVMIPPDKTLLYLGHEYKLCHPSHMETFREATSMRHVVTFYCVDDETVVKTGIARPDFSSWREEFFRCMVKGLVDQNAT